MSNNHRDYHTRALKSKDPRFAHIFESLGYERRDLQAIVGPPAPHPIPPVPEPVDNTAGLRAEYELLYGKRPFMGWDAEKLEAKIAEWKQAQAEDDVDAPVWP
jgi:hypothetical protein